MSAETATHNYAGKTATIIGGGVIGGSWAALFLVNGLKVIVSDPDPDIAGKVTTLIRDALPSLATLGYRITGVEANLSFQEDNQHAVKKADIVQECGPEKPEFKQALWKAVEAVAPASALFCSSSSSIPASVQFTQMSDRTRLLIGHPFNPPHLMPLVEVVPTPQTDPTITERVLAFYRAMGKVALEIKKEVPGFVANRLQAAIFQESVYLVREGVLTVKELDEVVTNSLGIRWATSGPFLSFHLGGGSGGLPHFLDHLGPATEAAWRYLGKAKLDDTTRSLLTEQSTTTYGSTSISKLSEVRDAQEIAVIQSLAQLRMNPH